MGEPDEVVDLTVTGRQLSDDEFAEISRRIKIERNRQADDVPPTNEASIRPTDQ